MEAHNRTLTFLLWTHLFLKAMSARVVKPITFEMTLACLDTPLFQLQQCTVHLQQSDLTFDHVQKAVPAPRL